MAGDALGYWRFFPAPGGWGRLPTMGFGDVIASKHADVAVGTRCFGGYPMSRYLVVQPSAASPAGVPEGAPHRDGLAPAYNRYRPTEGDALYQPDHEDALMLMRGLFLTSFLADDCIAGRGFGDPLRYSCSIGATHWDQTGAADWGPAELRRRLGDAWAGFRSFSEGWLQVQRGTGREAVERVYDDTLAGRTEPQQGHVPSLWDAA